MGSVQFQHTITGPAVCAGVGVHSGERARLTLKPAQPGTGIRFVRTDLEAGKNVISAHGDCVTDVRLGTTLANDYGATVSTVEHLMAACVGVGIDNLMIEIDGPEVPIMDGSSALYCSLLLQAGLRRETAPRRLIRILEPIEVRDGQKHASLSPVADDYLTLTARIDFDTAAIGQQEAKFRMTPSTFADELAFARTFGFAKEVETLQSMGLAKGASLENAVAIEGDTILNPEGLRAHDEFVRHKILDAIGDLALAGGHIAGHYRANQPGHAINNLLVRKLLEDTSTWCWETSDIARPSSAVSAAAR